MILLNIKCGSCVSWIHTGYYIIWFQLATVTLTGHKYRWSLWKWSLRVRINCAVFMFHLHSKTDMLHSFFRLHSHTNIYLYESAQFTCMAHLPSSKITSSVFMTIVGWCHENLLHVSRNSPDWWRFAAASRGLRENTKVWAPGLALDQRWWVAWWLAGGITFSFIPLRHIHLPSNCCSTRR